MRSIPCARARRVFRSVSFSGLVGLLGGCATLLKSDPQAVRVSTRPAGRTLYYQGERIDDGGNVRVKREFHTPRFNVDTPDGSDTVEMKYSLDPWLLGDAGLAVFLIIPGVVAGGIDLASGAWRRIDDPQVVTIGEAATELSDDEARNKSSEPVSGTGQTATAGSQASETGPAAAPKTNAPAQSKASASADEDSGWQRVSVTGEALTQESAGNPPAAEGAKAEGIVSWYEPEGQEPKTASGADFNPQAMAAAHRTLPFGTVVRVTRLDNGQSVEVTINDRGPRSDTRILDLTRKPAEQLGLIGSGLAPCRVEVIRLPSP